jgi:Tol biopolymer transport system component
MTHPLDRRAWQRVAALFDEASVLPPSERAGFLDRACAGAGELRAEVEALLAADAQAAGFLAGPADPTGRLLAAAVLERGEEAAAERAGERLGAHRLVREIGRGGMGTVYLAERVDGQFEQRVAIKLIRSGKLGDRVLRDFLRERQILARLEHPHIARLLDGGLTPAGEPYFVMEHVAGLPITDYCAHHRLAVEERLRLFLAVCEAVAAAHRAQVVHRDLKPSNILVDAAGEVKLLDFGIAKVLGPQGSEATRTAAPMTPLYAAPEQIRGLPATERTDVYALGLLLYELLTGRRAHQAGDESPEALVRAVLESEPARPSAAAGADPAAPAAGNRLAITLRRRLRGDLDNIVLKALCKDPAGRYPSAAALGEDVRRHLAGEPVAARGRGLVYRGAKGLRRHRTEVAAGAIAVIAVVGWIVLWRATSAPAPLRFARFSTFAGSHRQPALSPDGRRVAFIQEDAAGIPQIFLKDIAGGGPLQRTRGAPGARLPRWSSRGTLVYDVPGQGIWSVPAGVGEPRQIVALGSHPNLSRDGAWLIYEWRSELFLAHGDGSGARAIPGVRLHFAFDSADPALSPDGGQVVYFQDTATPIRGDLYVVPVAGGRPRRLTFDDELAGDPVWTPDGTSIVFSSARGGSLTLWRVPAAGGTPVPLTSGSGEDTETSISADGRRLIYANSRAVYSLSWLRPSSGARRTLVEERAGKTEQLFTVAADGSGERQLTTDPRQASGLPNWSADGRWIYFYRVSPSPALLRMPAGGGLAQVVAADFALFRHVGAHVDPAGRRLVYPVIENGAARATRVRDLASGEELSLAEPLAWPRWSPDGRSIAGSAADGRLSLCPADGTPCRPLSHQGGDLRWSQGWVYFARYSDLMGESDVKTMEIRRVRPDGTGEEHVADLPGAHPVHFFYDVSAAGDIVWCEYRPSRSELWTTELP